MEDMQSIWNFLQNEILGMGWLYRLLTAALTAFGLDKTGKIGGSILFFIYDTIKIMVLLGVLILIISYVQSFFPPERTKKILGGFTASVQTVWRHFWAPSRPFARARPFRCLWDLQARGSP